MRVSTSNTISLVNGQNIAVKKLYNTNDIVKTVLEVYSDHYSQAADLAAQLQDSSIKKTCKNIYDFIRSNVKYVEDGTEKQIVAAPARLLQKKSGDCKSMTVLAASILKCLNIPHLIRFVGYKDAGTPNQYTHVYVIVTTGANTYITIDPVHHKFNSEVSGISIYRDYPKNQSKKKAYMNGYSVGQTRWQRFKAAAEQKAKTVTLMPVRGAFLALLQLNVLAIASLIYYAKINDNSKYTEILQKWYNYGGNRTEFDRVLEKGRKNHPIGKFIYNAPVVRNLKFVDSLKSKNIISGIGADPASAAATATTVSAALPFLIAIGGILTTVATIIVAVKDKDPIDLATGGTYNTGANPDIDKIIEDLKNRNNFNDIVTQQNEEKAKKDNTLLIGGAALAAIAFFLVPTIKGKK